MPTIQSWVERQGRKQLELRSELEKFRKKRQPPPPMLPPRTRKPPTRLDELLFPRGMPEAPIINPFRFGTAKMTAEFDPRLLEEVQYRQDVETGRRFPRLVETLGGGAGQFRSPEAFRQQVESERQAESIRRSELAQSPNFLIRAANTPTVIFGLTPADIAGIGVIAAGGAQAAKSLYDRFLAFQRLPQYRAMESFARERGVPKDSPEFQKAKSALRSAFNAYKTGATELADQIMARFNQAYSRATQPIVQRTTRAIGTRPIPRGTQTGAMAFGGKIPPEQPINPFRQVLPPAVPAPEVVPAKEAVVPEAVPEELPKRVPEAVPERVTPAPEVTIPKATRALTEAEKPAIAEYYRKEAQKWRNLADQETLPTNKRAMTKAGEQRYVTAIQKAEAFEKAASELAIPKAEAVKYPATLAGAEARATAEGIPISEASRLNAEEAGITEPLEVEAQAAGAIIPSKVPLAQGAGGTVPPIILPDALTSSMSDPPPSITPGPMAKNIIGLRTITPGLTRQQTINNWMRRQFSKVYKKVGGHELVLEDALATPAIKERARVAPIIESQANDLSAKVKVRVGIFKLDKKGRIPALAKVIPEIGAPTIQDVAARLPVYLGSLTDKEIEFLTFLKDSVKSYSDLLGEVGVELRTRGDVMEGGFYLPRSSATLENMDMPYKVSGARAGTKKGFEKPAVFDSMTQGIEAGYTYPSLSDALGNYAEGSGQRATDAHVVNYLKALTDDSGRLLGETPKIRMLRQNPAIAKVVDDIKANLVRLKSNIGALTQRQMDVIDLWANDPEFAEMSEVIISLQEGLSTMRGGTPPQTMAELKALLKDNLDALKSLKPEYDRAMRRAQVTPREQGVINVNILPSLQGRTFPIELANAINIVLNQEGPVTGRGAGFLHLTSAFNALWAMGHATLDLSASAIQGLLLAYDHPVIWAKAFGLQAKSLFSDKVSGQFLLNFDAGERAAGRLTSLEWNRESSRMSGETGFLETIGVSEKVMNLPIIKQSNRAFSNFGDVARKLWNRDALRTEMAKGRSLDEIRTSGDLERISFGSNVMTGWSREGFGSSIGQMLAFAPRWLQARLSTLTLAAKGLRLGASIDQAMARNSILKLIGLGTILTVAANAALDEETDFRPVVDGKRNPHFMRVKVDLGNGKYEYISLFGSWDSLLGAMINIGTGRPLNTLRNMGSGVVAVGFDVVTGRDYRWREVGSKPIDPLKLAQWIGRSALPYAWGDLPETYNLMAEGNIVPGVIRVGSELLGVKSYIEEPSERMPSLSPFRPPSWPSGSPFRPPSKGRQNQSPFRPPRGR